MDLNEAIRAHSDWKIKLRAAINQRSRLDIAGIARDNLCPLGQWLHGESRQSHGALDAHKDCLKMHAKFHLEAAKVATLINTGNYPAAEAALQAGTGFTKASSEVTAAIMALMRKATA